ncbi:ATP-binding cassette domain-containing protein [Streptomyces avicenniae]|uniref:ATP-binding cassette domain-containing protein n=1 Tax=Streptomyces avicenniae TaxID=500153 RepID=UPI000A982E16|nr:ATP-binding cassette domain-containing protein [Streptomyces avicenniae]
MTAKGPVRQLLPGARRFLWGRRRALRVLAGWSLLESAQTLLTGLGVARALDDGFLAGRPGTGLLWLGVSAVGALLGGLAARGVFGALGGVVEPLRDALVRRVVARALATAVADPARADTSAVSRLTAQTEIARDGAAGLLMTTRAFVFTAAGALAGLAMLAPVLLPVVLVPLLAGLALFAATLRPMAARQRALLDADEALAAHAGLLDDGARQIVACGAAEAVAERTADLVAAERRAASALARWAAVRTLAVGAAGQLPVLALLGCAPLLLERGVSPGELIGALTYAASALLPAVHALLGALGAAGTRLVVVLERLAAPAPPPVRPPRVGRPAAPASAPRAPAAELRSVTFAHGPAADPVVSGLDLTLHRGEHLAVVGPSGIGKSTLTALLAGTLAPDRGTALLAGRAVAELDRRELAGLRALLPQEAYVFSGPLRDNLTYLAPDAPPALVRRAVEAFGLGGLADGPGGLDTPLDPARLSAGERQAVALARAWLSPAPLLLLDEATSHLDPAAELRAEAALSRRPGTLLVVAHRLSSAARADRVLLLDGPRPALGTHAELLRGSAAYRELVGAWEAGTDGGDGGNRADGGEGARVTSSPRGG